MSRETERALADLFEECAQLLLEGESAGACLARYPEQAAVLAPLLQSVSGLHEYGGFAPRDASLAAAGRDRFLAAVQSLPGDRQRGPGAALAAWWAGVMAGFQVLRPVPVALAAFLVCVVLAGVLTTGVVTASAKALPGDSLYGVKLVTEQARLLLTVQQEQRAILNEAFRKTRVDEAATIRQIRRSVPELKFSGNLEAARAGEWRVASVPIRIVKTTTISGTPVLGRTVHAVVQAPGDGSLIAISLVVDPLARALPPAPGAGVAAPSSTATSTATPRRATRTPPATLTATATAVPAFMGSSPLPTPPALSPTGTSRPVVKTATPLVALTPTSVLTATASVLPSSTPTTRPTVGPTPRPVLQTIIKHGYVTAIQDNQWTIDDVTVITDGDTEFINGPRLGDLVDAKLRPQYDGTQLALSITALARPLATPETWDISGTVEGRTGLTLIVMEETIHMTRETQIIGDPQVGDVVTCRVQTLPNGIYALKVEKLAPAVVEFTGTIEAIGTDNLTVFGRVVYFDANTQFTGAQVALGRVADVSALQLPPNRLLAQRIYVRPDTPTPTDTAPPTDTPAPTDTPVPPAATATSTPAPADTPVPPAATPILTPAPADTAVPPAATLILTPAPAETAVPPAETPTLTPAPPASPTGTPVPPAAGDLAQKHPGKRPGPGKMPVPLVEPTVLPLPGY